jgi:hypothetical protein
LVQRREVGIEMRRHGVGVDQAFHGVADHVQHAAALEAHRGELVVEHHGDGHADLLAGGEALEVDMLGLVGDGVELHVADEGAGAFVAQLQLEQARAPAGLLDFLQDRLGLQGDQGRCLLGAVDDCGHKALPPGRACCPLTCTLARSGLDRHEIGHWFAPDERKAPASRGAGA